MTFISYTNIFSTVVQRNIQNGDKSFTIFILNDECKKINNNKRTGNIHFFILTDVYLRNFNGVKNIFITAMDYLRKLLAYNYIASIDTIVIRYWSSLFHWSLYISRLLSQHSWRDRWSFALCICLLFTDMACLPLVYIRCVRPNSCINDATSRIPEMVNGKRTTGWNEEVDGLRC